MNGYKDMKLSSKPESIKYPEKKEVTYKKVYVDWKLYEVDETIPLGNGKYRDKTIEWVIDNDQQYYQWMVRENIVGSWGLIKLRKPLTHSSDQGEKWIMLIEYPGRGIVSPFLND